LKKLNICEILTTIILLKLIAMLDQIGETQISHLKNTPATIGIIIILYANAQKRFMLIKRFPFFNKRIKARIL
jgi:hypothetical protein